MTRGAQLAILAALLVGCSAPRSPTGLSDAVLVAMRHLHIGMKDADAVAVMRPVSLDSGRVYWGGSGASRLYFQLSRSQQLWVEVSGAPSFTVSAVGTPEPKSKWTRHSGDSISVQ